MSRLKGSILTEEHKINIAQARKGQQNTLGKHWKRKDQVWNKGKNKKDYPQLSNSGRKKGSIPWNKNLRGWMSEKERKIRSERMKTMLAEKSPNWRGGNYDWIHKWIRKEKGKPIKCEICSSDKNVEWANKSYQYKREIDDWISLCKSCHHKWDRIWEKRQRKQNGQFL